MDWGKEMLNQDTRLEFTPLEFETSITNINALQRNFIRIYSVGV